MQLAEIRTKPIAQIDMPVQFSRLRDIAYNLWWSWSPRAQALFEMIDATHWLHYRSPIEVLIDLEPERWHFLQNDVGFIRAYRALVSEFDAYMAPEHPTWFEQAFPQHRGGPIAYFSTEYGWHESLQSYSGGLGILSGDHSKSASDLGLPFVGVGLMYRRGYFWQTIDADGQQQHFYPDYDVQRLPLLPVLDPEGRELRVRVDLAGRRVDVRVWKASVGRVPVLLLDCDLLSNHAADRSVTSILYIRGREMRLCQEIVLGLGGVQVLKALGIAPAVWHINEGHSALLSLQRAADHMRLEQIPFEEALSRVASNAVFTTHTPVPAGNELFDPPLIRKYFSDWAQKLDTSVDRLLELGRSIDQPDEGSFNLTALALRTSSRANGVSRLHGEVAGGMWKQLLESSGKSVEHVTNGVHLPTWLGPEIGDVLRRHLGGDFTEHLLDPEFADKVRAIPNQEVWAAHLAQKRRLIALARERALEQFARHGRSPEELTELDHWLDAGVLLIGFARRFATYKRADLLLRDIEQVKAIVNNSERPVHFLFAGKAHPADRPGQDLIRRIFEASLGDELKGRLLFLENYDMRVGRGMVQGVDVWLNNPRRPLEASGTSGMKAAMNGALNFSVLDGWWCEGYDAAHGRAIEGADGSEDENTQDGKDAEVLYRICRDEVARVYYERDESGLPGEWIARMKHAIGQLSCRFSTSRMVREYAERYYMPLGTR
jgi:starch phosphorylase